MDKHKENAQDLPSFLHSLDILLKKANDSTTIELRTIFNILAGKGYAALFILLSFPFCMPIQVPGFSTPFGSVLGFLSLRYIFAKRLWWPEWILSKQFSGKVIAKMTEKTIHIVKAFKKVSRSRLTILTQNAFLHRLHGVVIFALSLLLLLPLPIPGTNMLTALPILCLGLGLLEDDGLLIIAGYLLAALCLGMFLGLFLLGGYFF
ncbi:MAG: exopolysaccharide biosynthesis protein [Parachlamydiaceae bacterium]